MNDEPPFYNIHSYHFDVSENETTGFPVGALSFDDPDILGNQFSFEVQPIDSPFEISSEGILILTRGLDFESLQTPQFNFTVKLSDGVYFASGEAVIVVNIVNVNEFAPTLTQDITDVLEENKIPESGIVRVRASDQDLGLFGRIVRFELTGTQSHLFAIDDSGVITNRQKFDYELDQHEFTFMGVAYDGGGKSSSVLVHISLLDVNDNSPVFEQEVYSVNISESATSEVHNILHVRASDSDGTSQYNTVTYSLPTGQPCSEFFQVHPSLGIVRVVREIDYESHPISCQLTVTASDPEQYESSTTVQVTLTDSNEHPPVIQSQNGEVAISTHEALDEGALVFELIATDGDAGPVYGAVVSYTLQSLSPNLPFVVTERGEIRLSGSISKNDMYNFQIFATDGGGIESEPVSVRINVTQANFFSPMLTTSPNELTVDIEENIILSQPLWIVEAIDEDENDLTFRILNGVEGVIRMVQDSSSPGSSRAVIWLNNRLDFELASSYLFQIAAHDGFHSSPPAMLRIRVVPVNEHRPTFSASFLEIEIPENSPPESYFLPIIAHDLDRDVHNSTDGINSTAHGMLTDFYITGGTASSYFKFFNHTTNGRAVLTNTAVLDYEFIDVDLELTVQVSDGGGLTAFQPLIIYFTLFDQNDFSPEFLQGQNEVSEYSAEVLENNRGRVLRVFAIDRDSSFLNSQVTYRLVLEQNQPFEVDTQGLIFLTRPLDYETDPIIMIFTVVAEDLGGLNDSATVTVSVRDVNEFAPVFNDSSITISIPENSVPSSLVYTFRAVDRDGSDIFGSVGGYRSSNVPDVFFLDEVSGDLFLNSVSLDFESGLKEYNFELTASDLAGLSSIATVTVRITDVNEYPPEFEQTSYTLTIEENSLPEPVSGYPMNALIRLVVTDRDGTSGSPSFDISDSSSFVVDTNGYLIQNTELDYETNKIHKLLVFAYDGHHNTSVAVTISVLNINDNVPSFLKANYTACIVENVFRMDRLAQLMFEDLDGALNALTLTVNPIHPEINVTDDGSIYLTGPLDYENTPFIQFSVSLFDGTQRSATDASINVYVLGVNDFLPQFETREFRVSIFEGKQALGQISFDEPFFATDNDMPNLYADVCVPTYLPVDVLGVEDMEMSSLSYSILEQGVPFEISIHENTGLPLIEVTRELDFETERHQYTLTIVVTDGEFESLRPARIIIELLNRDDNTPEFEKRFYEFSLFENSVEFSVTIKATDADMMNDLTYSLIIPPEVDVQFNVNAKNGTIFSGGPFDFESYSTGVNFTLSAVDGSGHTVQAFVSLLLIDVNDIQPSFVQSLYEFSMPEDSLLGETGNFVVAIDGDASEQYNTITSYFVTNTDVSISLPFSIDRNGQLLLSRALDYETGVHTYRFNVTAIDSGGLSSLAARVVITVTDVLDTAPCPTLTAYTASVVENVVPINPLFTVELDVTSQFDRTLLVYELNPPRDEFMFDENGVFFLISPLDYELEIELRFNLTVLFDRHSCPTTVTITVGIVDVYDVTPEFTQSAIEVSVSENVPPVNIALLSLVDTGDEDVPILRYILLPSNVPFLVSGGTLRTTRSLDAEQQSNYTFDVFAVVTGNVTSEPIRVTVLIADDNEFVPEFLEEVYERTYSEDTAVNEELFRVEAVDRDAGSVYGTVTYAIFVFPGSDPVPFAISETTGAIYLNVSLDYEKLTELTFYVIGTDGGGYEMSTRIYVVITDVNEYPPQFEQLSYVIRLAEEEGEEVFLFTFEELVTDSDSSRVFGTVVGFEILPNGQENFPVNVTEFGDIITTEFAADVDYDSGHREFQFQLVALDGGGLYSVPINVTLVIENINDLRPIIQQQVDVRIPHTTPPFSDIVELSVYATDPDNGLTTVQYFIINEVDNFQLNELNGTLYTTQQLDVTGTSSYQIYVVLFDGEFYSRVCTVEVYVFDTVNLSPYFNETQFNLTIRENSTPEEFQVTIQAFDDDAIGYSDPFDIPDSGRISSYQFILAPLLDNPFTLSGVDSDTSSTTLSLSRSLDFENECEFTLRIAAIDGGGKLSSNHVELFITVFNENEYAASFPTREYSIDLQENSLLQRDLEVSDQDREGDCGEQTTPPLVYSLMFPSDTFFPFNVTQSGVLTSTQLFDFEQDSAQFIFDVVVTDGQFSDSATISVSVTDQNEFSPVLEQAQYGTTIRHDVSPGTTILNLTATDNDSGDAYGVIVDYRLVSPSALFSIRSNGELVVVSPLAADVNSYRLLVVAVDGGGRESIDPAIVNISVIQASPPQFLQLNYSFTVTEESAVIPILVGQIRVSDNTQSYMFEISPNNVPFLINSSGAVFMTQRPDYEEFVSFQFSVTASDGTRVSMETAQVRVMILNINDHSPYFTGPQQFSLPENSFRQFLVLALDLDRGVYGQLSYRLTEQNTDFTIDQNGTLSNLRHFDYESGDDVFMLTVQAQDTGGLTGNITIVVEVTDENEFPPVFEKSEYNTSIVENFIGQVLTVRAVDRDNGDVFGTVIYGIETDSAVFDIDPASGAIKITSTLDYEVLNSDVIDIIVVATDGGGLKNSVTLSVYILDENDHAPIFTESAYSQCIYGNSSVDNVVLTVTAVDSDRGNIFGFVANYRLIDTSQSFQIDSQGSITLSQQLQGEKGDTFELTVTAVDGGGRSSQPVPVSLVLCTSTRTLHFTRLVYDVVVTEETLPLEPIVQLLVSNETERAVMFKVLTHQTLFRIDSDGLVFLTTPLDYELATRYLLTIRAFDGMDYSDNNATLRVSVFPVNEHRPMFDRQVYRATLAENSPPGSLLIELALNDDDSNPPNEMLSQLGSHGDVQSVFVTTGDFQSFNLTYDRESQVATITNVVSLNFENNQEPLIFEVVAQDGGLLNSIPVQVSISLIDTNDEKPVFQLSTYQFSVLENSRGIVGEVIAVDADISPEFNQIRYNIIHDSDPVPFIVHTNGSLELLRELDYEIDESSLIFSVVAIDNGGLNSSASVEITLVDLNEFRPMFENPPSSIEISENIPFGTIVATLVVSDKDGGGFGQLTPPLIIGQSHFLSVLSNGSLFIESVVDFEAFIEPSFNVTIEVCDIGQLCTQHTLSVTVLDTHDLPPVFNPVEYSVQINEEQLPIPIPGFPQNALLRLQLENGNGLSLTFTFQSSSNSLSVDKDGYVILSSPLDAELDPLVNILIVDAFDGVLRTAQSAVVTVTTINVNDNPPVFVLPPDHPIWVSENNVPDGPLYTFLAEDYDNPLAEISFHIVNTTQLLTEGQSKSGSFTIKEDGGLYLEEALDYETVRTIDLMVVANDSLLLSDPISVTINIIGQNDNPPIFKTDYVSANLSENDSPGSLNARILATDADLPNVAFGQLGSDDVRYEIITSSAPFTVNFDEETGEGVITNDITFDYETMERVYELQIRAVDSEGLESETPVTVVINIVDVNDFSPEFERELYNTTLVEGSTTLDLTIRATDNDGSAVHSAIIYSIVPEEARANFSISEAGEIELRTQFDYETGPASVDFAILAENSDGQLASMTSIHIDIVDSNDHTPQFEEHTYNVSLLENHDIRVSILRVTAIDGDKSEKYGTVDRYSLAPSVDQVPFSIDTQTGDIVLTEALDFELGPIEYTLTIRAQDSDGLFSDAVVFVSIQDVNDNPPCPVDSTLSASVAENSIPDQPLVAIKTTDPDQTQTPTQFTLIGEYSSQFSIDSSGNLYLIQAQDREGLSSLQLSIQVSA